MYDVYGTAQGPDVGLKTATSTGTQWAVADPMLVISAAAAVTKNLAFGITHSVTYGTSFDCTSAIVQADPSSRSQRDRTPWHAVSAHSTT